MDSNSLNDIRNQLQKLDDTTLTELGLQRVNEPTFKVGDRVRRTGVGNYTIEKGALGTVVDGNAMWGGEPAVAVQWDDPASIGCNTLRYQLSSGWIELVTEPAFKAGDRVQRTEVNAHPSVHGEIGTVTCVRNGVVTVDWDSIHLLDNAKYGENDDLPIKCLKLYSPPLGSIENPYTDGSRSDGWHGRVITNALHHYTGGVLHRSDGPAVYSGGGLREWFWYGREVWSDLTIDPKSPPSYLPGQDEPNPFERKL